MLSGLSFLVAAETGAIVRRHVRMMVLLTMAIVTLIAAIVTTLVALHSWLLTRFTSIEASLMIAAGLLVLSIVFVFAAMFVRNAKRNRSQLASAALVMVPTAAKLVSKRADIVTFGLLTVVAV